MVCKMSKKKILYIRLDSSQLPEACDEIIIKDFNWESHFYTLLGKRMLEGAGIAGTMLYPGKLIAIITMKLYIYISAQILHSFLKT